MTLLVKYGAMPPPLRWWGVTYIQVTRELLRERVIKLRLPNWGLGYDVSCDEMRWGQRILAWYGRQGFRLGWYFGERFYG